MYFKYTHSKDAFEIVLHSQKVLNYERHEQLKQSRREGAWAERERERLGEERVEA